MLVSVLILTRDAVRCLLLLLRCCCDRMNLPAKNKMVPPCFVMHWAEKIPKVVKPGVSVTIFAGKQIVYMR